jgi:hypothetical protein
MITGISIGDITVLNQDEPSDIIVGMNTQLGELESILLPQQWRAEHAEPFPLGSVLSFRLDRKRQLHMLICHHLGNNGWVDADKYVRIGLDHLWMLHKNQRDFSVVQIGAGRIGTTGGADVNKIRAAMATSFLDMTLFMSDSKQPVDIRTIKSRQLSKPEYWNPVSGLEH